MSGKVFSVYSVVRLQKFSGTTLQFTMADLGEGPGTPSPPPPLILGRKVKEEMTEGRKAGCASKIEPGPLLSSKSGFATGLQS